jgi:hypothetical protein
MPVYEWRRADLGKTYHRSGRAKILGHLWQTSAGWWYCITPSDTFAGPLPDEKQAMKIVEAHYAAIDEAIFKNKEALKAAALEKK